MKERINDLDYLKATFIVLMVMFHLVHFSGLHPYLTRVVYTFHMPAFLIISGYLTNVSKGAGSFFRTQLWIFVPYALMEACYVVASGVLPVRDGVGELSLGVVLHSVFVDPLGPYWYLHTLVICSLCYYLVYRLFRLLGVGGVVSPLILLSLLLFVLSEFVGLMDRSSAMYFLIGVAVFGSGLGFRGVFVPSLWSVVPLVWLCCYGENLDRFSLPGLAVTYLVISFLMSVFGYLGSRVLGWLSFLGRNTLVVLLFSPIFTMLAKLFVPVFEFDGSGVLFMVVSVCVALFGCFSMGWLFDRLSLSRYFFGRDRVIN